jgi:glycosyltransferase involved in cell wall biosynthesis
MSPTDRRQITRPPVSVVTACHNSAEFLDQCMQSVVAQELPEVEYVVIDGGSTDGTVDIIKSHSARVSYWHSIPDRGIGHAFNLGLAHSHGDWILFLNADDYLCRTDALQLLAARAVRTGKDVVYARVQPVSREANPRPLGEAVGWPYSPRAFLFRDLIPHPAALTSRAYFDRFGAFREDLKIVLDYDLYLRSHRTLHTVFVPEVLTHMRVGGVSGDRVGSLAEMLRVQKANRVLPPVALAVLRQWLRAKASVGRVVRGSRSSFEVQGPPRPR